MMGKAARERRSPPNHKGKSNIYKIRTVLESVRERRLQGATGTECHGAPSLQDSQTPQLSCLAELGKKSAKMFTDSSRASEGWRVSLQ